MERVAAGAQLLRLPPPALVPGAAGRLPRHVPRLTLAEATDLASRRDTGLSNPTGGATQTEAA
jgi:hypothetical protein